MFRTGEHQRGSKKMDGSFSLNSRAPQVVATRMVHTKDQCIQRKLALRIANAWLTSWVVIIGKGLILSSFNSTKKCENVDIVGKLHGFMPYVEVWRIARAAHT